MPLVTQRKAELVGEQSRLEPVVAVQRNKLTLALDKLYDIYDEIEQIDLDLTELERSTDMAISPEAQVKVAEYREKARNGTITTDELREALVLLRGDRERAAHASDASRRKKAVAAIPKADDLLAELGL